MLDLVEDLGYEINLYGVPDLEAFLEAALLLPTSVTADFNFPEWDYGGRVPTHGGARLSTASLRAVGPIARKERAPSSTSSAR